MSPDPAAERIVADTIASALRRARMVAIAEALACGLAAGAASLIAGAAVAAAVAWWRWRSTSRASVVRALERSLSTSHNLLVTADEIARGALPARPVVRARVFADAASSAARLDPAAVFPVRSVAPVVALAIVAWAVVGSTHLWRGAFRRATSIIVSRPASRESSAVATGLRLTVVVQPPPYTGVKETRLVEPEQLQVIEGSTLVLSIETSAAAVRVEHDGAAARPVARGVDGRFVDRVRVAKTGYLTIVADPGGRPPASSIEAGTRRTLPIVVSPDALPAVRVTAPGRDLVYAGGNPRIVFEARATDDFGLRSLALRYTKVTGSDENYEFHEGEIPLSITPSSARDWRGTASRSLAELNLADGDMLVYRAVAADARPGDGSASSDAFIIEISKLGVAAGDAFTLPEEESKYALSQQMLIVKTERLHQRRGSLAPAEVEEQALNLAVEQRMIRAEFVFMLGGEINDEEVEAEQSVELQAGRLQNRGQRDLRAATIAMSQAQKLLTAASTGNALVAERAAVAALQRAFSRDRYILRAMASRSQLDASRRLTGVLSAASGWRRIAADAAANRRAALLEDLLRGIGELAGSGDAAVPPAPGSTDQRALVLAGEAIRIDPASASLRDAATALQRAAGSAEAAARSRALAAAAAAVSAEARRAHADAPLPAPPPASALSGAFADAIRRSR